MGLFKQNYALTSANVCVLSSIFILVNREMANGIYLQSDKKSSCIVLVAFANLDWYLQVPNSKSKTLIIFKRIEYGSCTISPLISFLSTLLLLLALVVSHFFWNTPAYSHHNISLKIFSQLGKPFTRYLFGKLPHLSQLERACYTWVIPSMLHNCIESWLILKLLGIKASENSS